MEKKFILKSNLEDVVGHLMGKAIEHAGKIQVEFTISRSPSEELTLNIRVWDAKEFDIVTRSQYTIVPDVEDEIDVDDDTIGLALAKIEGRYQAVKEQVESNTSNS